MKNTNRFKYCFLSLMLLLLIPATKGSFSLLADTWGDIQNAASSGGDLSGYSQTELVTMVQHTSGEAQQALVNYLNGGSQNNSGNGGSGSGSSGGNDSTGPGQSSGYYSSAEAETAAKAAAEAAAKAAELEAEMTRTVKQIMADYDKQAELSQRMIKNGYYAEYLTKVRGGEEDLFIGRAKAAYLNHVPTAYQSEEGLENYLKGIVDEHFAKEIFDQSNELRERMNYLYVNDPDGNYAKLMQTVEDYTKIRQDLVHSMAGDPVRVPWGQFAEKVTDYRTACIGDDLIVYRNFRKTNEKSRTGSFGKNWISSLDARLLRGEGVSREKAAWNIKQKIEEIDLRLSKIQDFISENEAGYKSVEDRIKKERPDFDFYMKEDIEKLKAQKEDFKKVYANLHFYDSRYKSIKRNNESVSFGDFENFPPSEENLMFFEDADGSIITFVTDGKSWSPLLKEHYGKYELISLEAGNRPAKSTYGWLTYYEIRKADGSKIHFNFNGMSDIYIDKNGNKNFILRDPDDIITKLQTSSGEIVFVVYNSDGLIERFITDKGDVTFEYQGKYLTKVTDYNGQITRYSYDADGDLTSIYDSSGSREIFYKQYNQQKDGKRVYQIKHGNGSMENFDYDLPRKTLNYSKDKDIRETYVYDDQGRVTEFIKKESGNLTLNRKYLYSSDGKIIRAYENGGFADYSYDNGDRVTAVSYSDGTAESFRYDSHGWLTAYTDREGVSRGMTYDAKGNRTSLTKRNVRIESVTYDENGLPQIVEGPDNNTRFEYDNKGRVIKETVTRLDHPKKESFIRTRTWDSYDRLTSISESNGKSFEVSWNDNYQSVKNVKDGILVESWYDKKNPAYGKLIRRQETDLISGKKKDFRFSYGSKGLLEYVYLNSVLYKSFSYDSHSRLCSETVWNRSLLKNPVLYKQYDLKSIFGLRTDYILDSKGRVVSEKQRFVLSSDGSKMGECKYEVTRSFIESDENLLVKENDGGVEKTLVFSKDGKLSAQSTGDITSLYQYSLEGHLTGASYSDGFYSGLNREIKLERSFGGTETKLSAGSLDNHPVNNFNCVFGLSGEITSMDGPSGRYTDAELSLSIESSAGRKNDCDAWGNLLQKKTGKDSICFEYDDENRVVKKSRTDETVTFVYGLWEKPVVLDYGNGYVVKYEYDERGNVINHTENNSLKASYVYDKAGRLSEYESFPSLAKKITYDKKGNISSVTTNDFGKREYEWDCQGKTVSVYDSNHKACVYNLDSNGRPIKKTDRMKNIETYSYNDVGQLVNRGFGDGKTIKWSYLDNVEKKSLYDAEGKLANEFFTRKDKNGRIEEIYTQEGSLFYSYDTHGNVTSTMDKGSGVFVSYQYDENGNCTKKTGPDFEISMQYDKKNNLIYLSEKNSGCQIHFKYDSIGRETERTFESGISIKTFRNNTGLTEYFLVNDKIGQTVSGEFYMYDQKGRKIAIYDIKKGFTLFEYDVKGHVIKTVMPYDSKVAESARSEYIESGGNISFEKSDISDAGNISQTVFLPENIVSYFSSLVRKYGLSSYILQSQKSWIEEYSYNQASSVTSKKTPFGEICFHYDAENRLLDKKSAASVTGGTEYFWDKSGCLTEIKDNYKHIKISYNAFLRPEKMETLFLQSGKTSLITYSYDALGRRVSQTENGETTRFIYDGLTPEIMLKTKLYGSGAAFATYDKIYNHGLSPTDENKSYRLPESGLLSSSKTQRIPEGTYSKVPEARVQFLENDFNEHTDSFRRYEVSDSSDYKAPVQVFFRSGNQEVCSFIQDRRLSEKSSYCSFVTGYRDDVRYVFDKSGACISSLDYNLWGELVSDSDSSEYRSFSASQSVSDGGNLFYNLGFRDYCPSALSFMTPDPQRAGENAYAYCSGDPVNYSDLYGFCKKSLTAKQNADYQCALLKFLACMDYTKLSEIPGAFDCADTAAFLSYMSQVVAKADFENSEGLKNFANIMIEIEATENESKRNALIQKAKGVINSENFFDQNYGKADDNFRYTYNLREDFDKRDIAQREEEAKKIAEIIDIGSVLVWRGPDGKDPQKARIEGVKNWIGHVVTVISREYDANGNITGFLYLEGHTNGNKNFGIAKLSELYDGSFLGDFIGCGEIEKAASKLPVPEDDYCHL